LVIVVVLIARTRRPPRSLGLQPLARLPIEDISDSSASDTHPDAPSISTAGYWQRKAFEAERRAQRATALTRKGMLPLLNQWLKGKLMQKVITDRAALMETQQAATLKAMAVNERLSKIEFQIQQQNQAYEQRIEELMRELAVTAEENRHLIRDRIVNIKAEMEAARLRILEQAE
jgi:hypothetical protein